MKVLVADDSNPIRARLVERLLRLPDVRVEEAADTPDALRQMKSFEPDVAVLDIRMPGGGGIKALSAIKKDFPSVTVIMMTNYPYAQYRRKCLEAGADFFFDKSTEFEQVAETVRQLMESGDVSGVAHRTVAAQLVDAREMLEKETQRRRDMSILRLLKKSGARSDTDQAYAMWEKTFDAMPDMVAILDAGHTIVRVNKAMADRLDLPAAELTGKKCYEYMHGTSCPVSGCPHEALLRDHKEHAVEIYDEHLNGWFEVSVSPVFDEDELIGAIHIAHDITNRKTAEALAQQTLGALSAHIAIVDAEGAILSVNRAWEEFAIRNQLSGGAGACANYLAVCDNTCGNHVEDAKRFAAGLRSVLRGESDFFEMEYPCETETEQFWFCGRVTPFAHEGPRMAAVAHENITDRRRAEDSILRARDAAEEANRAKTQFLANMSHELRTPLNAVIGLSELLMDSPLSKEQLDYVQTINTSGEDLLKIVADLLDISKIEMNQLAFKTEPFAIREVVEKSLALLTPLAEKKGLDLSVDVEAAVQDQITGDADRLQQVLVNLLNNAIKFTEAGFVRLRVKECSTPAGSRCIEFSVEDSGCGIDSETLMRIFEPFQQGDNSNTREYGGSGLGLAISKNLVERMGGAIQVKSVTGEGSVFNFHIVDQAVSQHPVPVGDVREQWHGRCVCVWADDPADMRAAEVFLERIGVRPRYKTNLDEINICLTVDTPADVVLCNLDMPGLLERLLEFRKIRPDVPWIGFSNWMSPIDEQLKSCFAGFVDRPLKAEPLYGALMKISETNV